MYYANIYNLNVNFNYKKGGVKDMKAELEVLRINANDIVTASGCEFEACPGKEWDPDALEG